jgi:glycosyltransferase involved in cell wall biosynthesis
MNRLKIAIYHGYQLTGSGSNEYTRYLSRTLAEAGHDVVVICSEQEPEAHAFLSRAVAYDKDAKPRLLFERDNALAGSVSCHQLPKTSVYPVFITDRQRSGNVKTFPKMSAAELDEYHTTMVAVVTRALRDERPSVLQAHHLIYQPIVAAEACREVSIPFYIVPHGSAIEYTVNEDKRFLEAAREPLRACAGLVWISREVKQRVLDLYSDLAGEIEMKSHDVGIGTDTSLFSPLARSERHRSVKRLAASHVPGGKTPAQRQELRRRLDGGDTLAVCAYWDAYDFKLADEDLPALLEHLPVQEDLLFFVGALTYGKGVQSLIAALPGILARRPKTHLVIVGSGTFRETLEGLTHSLATGNTELFDELARRGRALDRGDSQGALTDLQAYAKAPSRRDVLFGHGASFADHVHFLGRLDHMKLRRIFPCCQIGVFPSVIKEASPLVFAEALANGVLPTGSYHSGLGDGLDDLQPYLPDAIWQLMKLETDPEHPVKAMVASLSGLLEALEKEDLSTRLRAIAEERYDWRAIAASLAQAAATML